MKLEFDNKHMMKIPVILASILLIIIAGLTPTMGWISREEEEKVESPDWSKGDEWVYEARIGPNQNDTKQITERVEKTGIEINPNINNDGEDIKYEDTYQVVLEGAQGEEIMNSYYDNNSLSLVFEDEQEVGNSYYHKGRNNLNFPLHVGKEWNQTCEVYKEEKGVYEKDHTEYLSGAVLETNMTEVEAGKFKTYKVNVEMLIKAENSTSRGKMVYYYSPKVKRTVKTEIYEVKKNPNNDELEERRVGTEELIEYEISKDSREFGLTVKTEGNGTVEVDGDEVENNWTGEFEEGTNVSIETIADESWKFDEWSGDYEGTSDEINIMMDSKKEITANFNEIGGGEGDDDGEDDNGDGLNNETDGDDGGDTPGFTSGLLLLGIFIAFEVYQKKKR